jgi:hypothetical protein
METTAISYEADGREMIGTYQSGREPLPDRTDGTLPPQIAHRPPRR